MRGTCPVCGHLIIARLQALGSNRDGVPKVGDLTVCSCKNLLVVGVVAGFTYHPIHGSDWQVYFRRANREDHKRLSPAERRVIDEAVLPRETFPGDRKLWPV